MDTLLVSKQKEVCWIRFHRPHVLNAANRQMLQELEQVIEELAQDEEIKVIVFSGSGRAFMVGGDLTDHHLSNGIEIHPFLIRMGALLEKMSQLNLITISAVQGMAVGGGCEIAASCDLCFASESATFEFAQVSLGITTAWGGASRLMQKIGYNRSLLLLLNGESVKSEEARELGLVDAVFNDQDFEQKVAHASMRFAQAPHSVIQTYKKIGQQVKSGIPSSSLYSIEAKSCSICWDTDQHKQSVEALLNRSVKKDSVSKNLKK